jgi:hypothetical protein
VRPYYTAASIKTRQPKHKKRNTSQIIRANIVYCRRGFAGGRDSIPVRGVPYEPVALLRVCRTKFESNR